MERGVIANRKYATQVRDFSGLRIGNITPTDIDGVIEYKNKCFILMETKYKGGSLPFGQKLALTRMIDNWTKPSILFVTEHESKGDIYFADTIVREYYLKGQWHEPRSDNLLLGDAIDMYLKVIDK